MLLDPVSLGIAVVSLVLVLALAAGLGRALRLAGVVTGGGGRRLAVIEAVAVDPKRRLVLLVCHLIKTPTWPTTPRRQSQSKPIPISPMPCPLCPWQQVPLAVVWCAAVSIQPPRHRLVP